MKRILDSSTDEGPCPKKQTINSCIKRVEHFTTTSKKYQLVRSKSKFVTEDIAKCANPAEALRKCIQNSIDEALNDAMRMLGGMNKIGIIISSTLLDQGDIIAPIRPITTNVMDAVFNQFQKVEQSKSNNVNLYGAPFVITVTVLNTDKLPRKQTINGRGKHPNDARSCILNVYNEDNFCLFYAVELMRFYSLYRRRMIPRMKWRWIYENQCTVLKELAMKLMQEAGISFEEPDYDADIYIHNIQKLWNIKYPGQYRIFVFNDYNTKPIAKTTTDCYQFPILLYYKNNHFDGIKTLGKMFNKNYYCLSCEKCYQKKLEHSTDCTSLCHGCREVGVDYPCEPQPGYYKKCVACKKDFYNQECFQRHLQKTLCKKFKKCEDCGVIYNVKDSTKDERAGHVCGVKFCKLCKQYHVKNKEDASPSCYIQPLKQSRIKPYRIITYDFECTQDKEVEARFEHEVNFVAATIICTECIKNGRWRSTLTGKKCEICGQHRNITFSPFNYNETKNDHKVLTKEPLHDFVEWILFRQNKKFATIAFAHFGGRYDMAMIISEIVKNGIHNPEIIKQGNRLYEMKIKTNTRGPLTIFRDSYNIMPIKLSGLIKSFGLKIEEKQHFPHMFNKSTNYDNVLDHLPAREDYCPNQKKKEELKSFDKWYINNYKQKFDLKEKLAEYCCNDVNILTHALVEVRREFNELTRRNGKHGGIDILWQAITIASACMKNFALNHMKPETLAIVPEKGYSPMQNQSTLALKYLDWYSHINNVNIQTAISQEGEYVFKKEGKSYMVDGFIKGKNGGKDKIIEVNGCLWHGCPQCYAELDEEMVMPNGRTMREIREKEKVKHENLRRYVDLEVVWEHDINDQLHENKLMKEFFDNWMDRSPIRIRDAFHGGRTSAMKLLHTVKTGYKISYKDFTSLYPWTNFSTKYPLGHPEVINIPASEQTVNWRTYAITHIKIFLSSTTASEP